MQKSTLSQNTACSASTSQGLSQRELDQRIKRRKIFQVGLLETVMTPQTIPPGYTQQIRVKVVDQLIRLCNQVHIPRVEHALFKGLALFDAYLSKSDKSPQEWDFELSAFTSFYIAAKYQSKKKPHMSQLLPVYKLKSLTNDQVRTEEGEVLQAIEMNLHFTSAYEFYQQYINILAEEMDVPVDFQEQGLSILQVTLYDQFFTCIPKYMAAYACLRSTAEDYDRTYKGQSLVDVRTNGYPFF